MPSGKSLTSEQNERARVWLRELLQRHGGSQTDVSKLLGVKQATVSRILAGSGTSVHVIQALARLLGREAGEALEPRAARERPRVIVPDHRFPSSHQAQEAALLLGCTAGDIEEAMAEHTGDDDPGDRHWINEFLRARDMRRRREQAIHPVPRPRKARKG